MTPTTLQNKNPPNHQQPKRRLLLKGSILIAGLVGLCIFISSIWFSGRRDAYESIDLDHLLNCVTRSNSCYHEPQSIRNEFGSNVEVNDFPANGLRVFIEREPGESGRQWVVLRGTINVENVFADLDFIERDEHELGIRVHSGFSDAAQECLPWVIARLDRNRPVCITGHSLGGSVAILLAAILEHRGFKDISAVTFGQPKITDFHGDDSLKNLNVLRVVFEDDPIPLMPPVLVASEHIDTYHHFGPEIILQKDGHFYYLDRHDADRLNIKHIWSKLTHIHPKTHILGNSYIPSLKIAQKRSGKSQSK